MTKRVIDFIRHLYKTKEFIPLHAPSFVGNELSYVTETINSTFVSSVGKFVDEFEAEIEEFTGTAKAVATVNGTAGLHAALYLAGVKAGDLVITQALTFVATCNAIYHLCAEPVFLDVSKISLSLSPSALENYLAEYAAVDELGCFHRFTQRRIRAVVPMHTFGHPAELDELSLICSKWKLVLVEDAAESLGSFYRGQHTGTIGEFGVLSFNGNKIITTGGGGMVLCKNLTLGKRAKHITTTAKIPHLYEFFHDEPGFNYRLPNLNAALGCAQMEMLPQFLTQKRQLAHLYLDYFQSTEFEFVIEPAYAKSNYWLNTIACPDKDSRDNFLNVTNGAGVMTRPIWTLMHRLPMFKECYSDDLKISQWAEAHLVNLPSSPAEFESHHE